MCLRMCLFQFKYSVNDKMDNLRYRMATTTRKHKSPSYETTAAIVNAVAARRQLAPSAGDSENHHQGRRHWSRRRDVYAVPDDVVSTMTPPAVTVADALRRRVDCSAVDAKSPAATLWAQPTSAAGGGTAARSRSRPRPSFLLERGVQRGEISGEYVDSSRYQEQQMRDEYQQQRNRQRQPPPHHAAGVNPSVEFTAGCAVDCRPQLNPNPTSLHRTTISPTPAPLSPSYAGDNVTLLKEALMSAAAAKLSRSSSARSALVRPLVVIRNGPLKSSSDEHVDVNDEMMTTKTPVSSDGPSAASLEHPEHTADVAVAAAAAAAATATRRSRTRRRDASSNVTASSAASEITVEQRPGTRIPRPLNCSTAATSDQGTQSGVAVPSVSGTNTQESSGSSGTKSVNCDGSTSSATPTSPSSNCSHITHVDDCQRSAALRSTPKAAAAGKTHVSGTVSTTKKTIGITGDHSTDAKLTSGDTPRRNVQRDKTSNKSSVNDRDKRSVDDDAETSQELPSSTSKVAFIKTILFRTRSPSPSRYRRTRCRVSQTSPSPSSVKRLDSVAQRIGEPLKGALKQLRDRSSQRRRVTEPVTDSTTTKAAGEQEPTACLQDREVASSVDSQPRSVDASVDERSTDDASSRGLRRLTKDRKKTDSGSSALTSQWKSTSQLTTPMTRLDNLLKANSLQLLQTSKTAALQTTRQSGEETSGTQAASSSSTPLLSKTSQSAGCLLTSSQQQQQQQSVERQMSRCYLEKPPRVARRAVTVQLEGRQTPSLGVTERQSASQTDLRHPPPATDEEPSRPMNDGDVGKDMADQVTPETARSSTTTSTRRLHDTSSSQNERDLRELYEQKRLERQLEEKLAAMERERADMIGKLWTQIDRRCETRQRATADGDYSRHPSTSSGLVLPLSDSTASPTECNNQMISDPLGDLLIELSSTPTATRWTERRRAARPTTAALRPRAASCSRRLVSDTLAAALPSKSLSHTQLHRKTSNCSDVGRVNTSNVQLRDRSHQQQQQSASARPLTCYLPVRDRNLDLRHFIEAAGHRLDQCGHVQLTATTCHGYLTKFNAGAAVRQWKRRWFVFDRTQRCLHYYTDKTEKRSDGSFVWFQTIQDVFVDHERRSRSPHPDCTFCVKTAERALFLIAPTPEAMRIWIDVIFTGAEGYQQFLGK